MAEIRVQNLHKSFGAFVAVRESSFTVDDGTFFCLLGPSGCGKTTTLRMIAGLELPTSGRILLDGADVTAKRASARDIAFVFQLFALYPHMNVRRNIAYPLVSMGVGRAEVKARVDEAARILRIDHLLDRPVSGLSGGDRQRVALGRAIVRRPLAFLMDEPLGALDAEFRHIMCGELRALHDRVKGTTVYVTHDQMEAMALGDRIAVMNHGLVEQLGLPRDIYARPATMFVADFIGSPPMNLLPCHDSLQPGRRALRLGTVDVAIPDPREMVSARDLVLGVRPEHVRLSDQAGLRGEVFSAEYLGSTQIVSVTTAHGLVRARLAASLKVEVGDNVGLSFVPDMLSVFDAATGRALRSALHEPTHAMEAAYG
jgi:multiple sugar transport system ATP-binding protein